MYTAQLTTSLGFWGAHVSLQELMADLGGNDPTLLLGSVWRPPWPWAVR